MPRETLPSPGLGTRGNEDAATIARAIELGYRHLDTAQKYGNEAVVGEGIASASVPREELFLATKVAEQNLSYDDVLQTTELSLNYLNVSSVDLLYVHWPAVTGDSDQYDPDKTLRAFNELHDDRRIDRVGVANFSVDLLEEARTRLDPPIFANQVEMHPLLKQDALVEYAREHDIYLVAYCPLMRGDIGTVEELREIAEKHDVTPAQVSLAWLMHKENVVPIPMSSGGHLEENFTARDVDLDSEDFDRIDAIEREERVVDPDKGPWNW